MNEEEEEEEEEEEGEGKEIWSRSGNGILLEDGGQPGHGKVSW
jgi:hypothetical protein